MESVIFIFLSALNYYIKFVILSTLYSITVMWIFTIFFIRVMLYVGLLSS